jgi:hypothetical protein
VPPFFTETHHDGSTLSIVVLQAKLHNSSLARNSKLLVDLMLNRQAMSVPSESALDMEALLRPVSRNDIFNGRGEQVAVMRQTGRERRAIVEGIEGFAFRQLDL